MLQVLGAGLSKTATTSLNKALQILGYNCLHFDDDRLNDILAGRVQDPDFRVYDDYDCVSDIPSAYFYKELLEAYPDCKCVLTVRNIDDWYNSVEAHFNARWPVRRPHIGWRVLAAVGIRKATTELRHFEFRTNLRNHVYGSIHATGFLYKKRYLSHIANVKAYVPPERLLVMDITAGDGWEKLCTFLGKPIPDAPFPFKNKADYEGNSQFNDYDETHRDRDLG